MGSFLDRLKAERFAPIAIRHRYRIEYNETNNDVYAFFESTDDATFYRRYVLSQKRKDGRVRIYYCGNKDSVWFHYEVAEKENKLRNALFFVDKDIDDLTGDSLPARSHIFVTDYYSIENYLCTEEAVRTVLQELIFLPDEGTVYADIVEHFQTGLQQLAIHLRPIFAEVIQLRRAGAKVLFSDLGDTLSPCFQMETLLPNPLPNWNEIFRVRCKYDPTSLVAADVTAIDTSLSIMPCHTWLRGKFALWYFVQFIGNLWTSLQGRAINDRKKIKKNMELKSDNVFVVMEGRHPTPMGLEQFIVSNIA
jgi:hypothetical protein